MREMKDSGIELIGNIPENWTIKRIKHLFSIFSGATPQSAVEDYWDGDVLWITPADYKTKDKYVYGGKRNISFIGLKSCSATMIPKGSIIFSKRAPIGTVAINNNELATNQGCLSCVPNSNCCAEFYYYFMSIYTEVFELLGSGTTFKEISASSFMNVALPYPNLLEQQAISNFLNRKCTEISSITTDIQTHINMLEQYKRSLITEVVTKGLNSDVKMKEYPSQWVQSIPSSWRLLRFKYIATVKSNLVEPDNYGDWPQVSPDNIVKDAGILLPCGTVEEAGIISGNHLFKKGQILYSKIRPKLNKVVIAPFNGLCSADMYPIETTQNYRFLKYAMLSDYFVSQVALITEDRVKMPKINQDELGEITVVMPGLEEQQHIADYLDDKCSVIDGIIVVLREQLDTLSKYKESVIYEYVTGKKEVPVA